MSRPQKPSLMFVQWAFANYPQHCDYSRIRLCILNTLENYLPPGQAEDLFPCLTQNTEQDIPPADIQLMVEHLTPGRTGNLIQDGQQLAQRLSPHDHIAPIMLFLACLCILTQEREALNRLLGSPDMQ